MTTRTARLTTYTPQDETAVCKPQPEDVRKDPTRCVIHNHIADELPWARYISVGIRTIRLYDYRCGHNPEGIVGKCTACPRRRLVWATPLPAAEAIKEFDRGGDPEFPRIHLRESEAKVEYGSPSKSGSSVSNDVGARRSHRKYNAKRSDKARAAAKRTRRKS